MKEKKKWTPKEEKLLLELHAKGKGRLAIAALLGRSKLSVKAKLEMLDAPPSFYKKESPWSPEKIEELKTHWGKGTGTKQIACLLGMTKSAIIGKAHRLRLKSRLGLPILKSEAKRTEPKPKVPPPEPIFTNGLGIMELNKGSCRWPSGDPVTFCPEPNDGKHVYCAYHSDKAFQPVLKKLKYSGKY